jgi:hypothetical protein
MSIESRDTEVSDPGAVRIRRALLSVSTCSGSERIASSPA